MHGDDMIDMGEVIAGYGVTGEDGLVLQLPWLDDGVHIIVAHRTMARIAQTDTIQLLGIDNEVRSGYRNILVWPSYPLTGEGVIIAVLAVLMVRCLRVDTADDIDRLGHKEGIVSHLVLLAVGVMVRIIGTRLDEDLEYAVTVLGGVRLTGSDDIVERIAQTVERIIDTRTHLAIDISDTIGRGVILQLTRFLGVDELRFHDVQTVQYIRFFDSDGVVLIHGAGTDIDEVVVLDGQRILSPRIAADDTRQNPCGAVDTRYIDGIERREFDARTIPLRIGHTGTRQRGRHLYRIIENNLERVRFIPAHTLRLRRGELDIRLTFQTAALYGAVVKRIIGIGGRTAEGTGYIRVIVRIVMPEGG